MLLWTELCHAARVPQNIFFFRQWRIFQLEFSVKFCKYILYLSETNEILFEPVTFCYLQMNFYNKLQIIRDFWEKFPSQTNEYLSETNEILFEPVTFVTYKWISVKNDKLYMIFGKKFLSNSKVSVSIAAAAANFVERCQQGGGRRQDG